MQSSSFLAIFALACLLLFSACGDNMRPSNEVPAVVLQGDSDGDGLTDEEEVTGWKILVDDTGFGFGEGDDFGAISKRDVSSDPLNPDTDGDGLDDYTEWLLRTDPRQEDTDRDGLTDEREWNQWFTSPVSVDSDGDARDPGNTTSGGAPNASLFDGEELKRGLSPTLADTDGDGQSDAAEIDDPFRSATVAELPRIKLEVIGDPIISLTTQYEKGNSTTSGSATELTTSTERSQSSSSTQTHETHVNWALHVMLGHEGAEPKGEVQTGVDVGVSDASTAEYSSGFSSSVQKSASTSREVSESRNETVTSGTVKINMRIRNLSDSITFELTQLGVAVRQWRASGDPRQRRPGDTQRSGRFQTIAVLTLAGVEEGAGTIILPPKGTTKELLFVAQDLNVDLVREFLANPSALTFEPLYFDLKNAENLSFAFLAEKTYTRTAMIEIDLGEGENQVFRVATNVDRSDGLAEGENISDFRGIPLKKALTMIMAEGNPVAVAATLRRQGTSPFETTKRTVEYKGKFKEVNVLHALGGKTGTPNRPPLFKGKAIVTPGERKVTVNTIAEDNTGKDPVLNGAPPFVQGWEKDWINHLFMVRDPVNGRSDRGYVIVAGVDDDGDNIVDGLVLHACFQNADELSTPTPTGEVEYEVLHLIKPTPHDGVLNERPGESFWIVAGTNGTELDPHANFEDLVLHAGDQLRLSFYSDQDGDRLSTRSEQYFGTLDAAQVLGDNPLDRDGDKLVDSVEALRGWIAGAPAVLAIEAEDFFNVVDAVRANPVLLNATEAQVTPLLVPFNAGLACPVAPADFIRLREKLKLDDKARGYPRWVRSNPCSKDGDGDGLDDLGECQAGTDPHRFDTDGDGVRDGDDTDPLRAARRLYVNEAIDEGAVVSVTEPRRGLRWSSAFKHLQDALAQARTLNADFVKDAEDKFVRDAAGEKILNDKNDVSDIWIAQGTYKPEEVDSNLMGPGMTSPLGLDSFHLVNGVRIVGGFSGGERALIDRAEPIPNTVLLGNGSATAFHPVLIAGSPDSNSTTLALALDNQAGLEDVTVRGGGFLGTREHGGGMRLFGGSPVFKRVVFTDNDGGGVLERRGSALPPTGTGAVTIPPSARYDGCSFNGNRSTRGGGGMWSEDSRSVLFGCTFEANRCPLDQEERVGVRNDIHDGDGGGLVCRETTTVYPGAPPQMLTLELCRLENNEANRGAGIALGSGDLYVRDCTFKDNTTRATEHHKLVTEHHEWVTGLTAKTLVEVVGGFRTGTNDELFGFVFYPGDANGKLEPNWPDEDPNAGLLSTRTGMDTNSDGEIRYDEIATHQAGGFFSRVDAPLKQVDRTVFIPEDTVMTFRHDEIVRFPDMTGQIDFESKAGEKFYYTRPEPYHVQFDRYFGPSAAFAYRTTRAGGGIFACGGKLAAVQCLFTDNKASVGGGIAFFMDSEVHVISCTLHGNGGVHHGTDLYGPDKDSMGQVRTTIAAGEGAPLNILPTTESQYPIRDYNLFAIYTYVAGGGSRHGTHFGHDLPQGFRDSGNYPNADNDDGKMWYDLTDFETEYEPLMQVLITGEVGAGKNFEIEDNLFKDAPVLSSLPGTNTVGGAGTDGAILFDDGGHIPAPGSKARDGGPTGLDFDWQPLRPLLTEPAPQTDITRVKMRVSNGRIDIGAFEADGS